MSPSIGNFVSLTLKREYVMLSNSKVLSFIDNKEGFTVYFFEGQKLIHDLAIIHDLKGEGCTTVNIRYKGLRQVAVIKV